ncbi:MAG: ABC transporter permease [bacterium]
MSERTRELPWASVSSDLRFGWRRLVRHPFVAIVAMASIAVSTAAVGAMFSVLSSTDWRQLPYASAERLSTIYTRHDAASSDPRSDGPGLSAAVFAEYRRRARSFERLEAVAVVTKLADEPDATPELTAGHAATPGFLSLLGVHPIMGRWFVDSDTASGAAHVAVLSYAYWQSRFGGDPAAIGKSVVLVDRFPPNVPPNRYEIIGVLPRSFEWDATSTFWLPISASEPQSTTSVGAVGPLRSGVSIAAANAELMAVAGDVGDLLEQMRPPGDRLLGGKLEVHATLLRDYLHDRVGGQTARVALFVLTMAILVLAIANLVFLNVLSTEARRGELAVRRALGAALRRLVRQTVVEAALVAVPGALAGVMLCGPLVRVAADRLHVAELGVVPTLDAATVGAMGVVALVITMALGVVPAIAVVRRDVANGMLGRGNGGSLRKVIAPQRVIVVVESAIAVVVLTAAGLVVKELARLEFQEVGYKPANVVLLSAPLRRPRPAAEMRSFGAEAMARVAAIPGVTGTAILATDFSVHLRGDAMSDRLPPTVPRAVVGITPDLFNVLGVSVAKGRAFTNSDNASRPAVVILSAEAARRLFPGADPIGRTLALTGMGPAEADVWTTIVGVVGDARVREDPTSPKQAVVYRPFAQARPFMVQVVARVAAKSDATYPTLRAAVAPLTSGPPGNWTVTFLQEEVGKYLVTPRFTAMSLSSMAAIALALAVIGIFGVTATSVSLRTREIAIRVALGAKSERIVLSIVREAALPVVLGLAVGLWASAGMSRLTKALLHGSSPFDASIYVTASIVLLGTAFVASLLPARRALRIDPARALRFE